MRKKVVMEIDDSGQVFGPDNWLIGSANVAAAEQHFGEPSGKGIKQVLKLKDAGFTAEEIMELKQADLI